MSLHNSTQCNPNYKHLLQHHSDSAGGVCNPTQPKWNHSSHLSHWIMSSLHLWHVAVTVQLYLYIWKESLCGVSSVMGRNDSIRFFLKVLAHFLLLEFYVTQVVSSCSMVDAIAKTPQSFTSCCNWTAVTLISRNL